MKRKRAIVCIAAGLAGAFLIGSFTIALFGNKPDGDDGKPADSDVSTGVPDGIPESGELTDEPTIEFPITTNPDGEMGEEDASDSGETAGTVVPNVEDSTQEDVKDKTPEEQVPGTKGTVVLGEKDRSTVETGPISGEDRNDDILKEKEEKAPPTTNGEDKPVIVEKESSVEGGEKGDAVVRDEETNVDEGNKNSPAYNPSLGEDNPFDNETKTEIDDTPVEEYIGEGEDRPGEGIHF